VQEFSSDPQFKKIADACFISYSAVYDKTIADI